MTTPNFSASFFASEFSDRMQAIPRSCIRELLSGPRQRLISFGGGVPHESCVPFDAIRSAFDATLTRYGARAFSYGASEGEAELREFIAREWLSRFGVAPDPDDILIVNGSQQAFDLLGKVLIDDATPVLVERPTYLAALQAFSVFQPRFFEVTLDGDGADPAAVRSAIDNYKPRFFYTIPTFQNPSGVCYSEARRIACAGALAGSSCTLVEDDPYSELYYGPKPPRLLCAMGVENAVLLGTFSKTVAPGFRLGWIWARGDVRRHLITVKQAADLCTGRFQQLLLVETLRHLDIEAHLQKNRLFYRQQRDRMHRCLTQDLSGLAEWDLPQGGMFFWARCAADLDSRDLLARCLQRGVAFADGASFHAGGGGASTMRLNFTQPSFDEIRTGVGRIAEGIREARA